ncbi:MAG: pyridoxal 5'-phosphate synthase glutaminase subunit PdxT, partial [Candidatus Ornithomonoglobus sp.]
TIPANVKRNAYGRQLGSFYTEGEFKGLGSIPMEFIRAPYIESVEDGVEVMSVTDGNITGVRYKNQLAVSFHPELCDDTKIFEYFLNM